MQIYLKKASINGIKKAKIGVGGQAEDEKTMVCDVAKWGEEQVARVQP